MVFTLETVGVALERPQARAAARLRASFLLSRTTTRDRSRASMSGAFMTHAGDPLTMVSNGSARRRVLVVGGVAGGASCAARLRRLDESAEIVIFDRGPFVSFANCGLPYYV